MRNVHRKNPRRTRALSPHHAQLEADIAQIERLRAAGLSPLEALAAFRATRNPGDLRDALARDAMRELLRGSSACEILDAGGGGAQAAVVASTAYLLADAMIKARSLPWGAK